MEFSCRNNTQFIAVRHVKAIKCLLRNIVIALSFNDRMLSLLSTVNGQRRDFKRKYINQINVWNNTEKRRHSIILRLCTLEVLEHKFGLMPAKYRYWDSKPRIETSFMRRPLFVIMFYNNEHEFTKERFQTQSKLFTHMKLIWY